MKLLHSNQVRIISKSFLRYWTILTCKRKNLSSKIFCVWIMRIQDIFSERFHLIVIDYFVRHALVVVQINYVGQTSAEVLLEVEFFGWQGKLNASGYSEIISVTIDLQIRIVQSIVLSFYSLRWLGLKINNFSLWKETFNLLCLVAGLRSVQAQLRNTELQEVGLLCFLSSKVDGV